MNKTCLRGEPAAPLLGALSEQLQRLSVEQKLERLEAAILDDLMEDDGWEEDLARAFASEP